MNETNQIVLVFAFALIILTIHCIFCYATVNHETITVHDKGIVVEPSGEHGSHSNYMVYTTNGQAIKNTNCIWFWKWHSDELQGKLHPGKTYRVKTYGIRIPFLGMYKHIISATPVRHPRRKK